MQYNPFEDRVVQDCPSIAFRPLPKAILFPNGEESSPDCEILLEHLKREGRLNHDDMMNLITRVRDRLAREHNPARLDDPVTIEGDFYVE